VVLISLAVALAFPSAAERVFAVTGATAVCAVVYVLPIAIHLKLYLRRSGGSGRSSQGGSPSAGGKRGGGARRRRSFSFDHRLAAQAGGSGEGPDTRWLLAHDHSAQQAADVAQQPQQPQQPQQAEQAQQAQQAPTSPSSRAAAAVAVGEEQIPKEYVCPISCGIMFAPVIAMDGHSYERAAIEEWIETRLRKGQPIPSPSTNHRSRLREPGSIRSAAWDRSGLIAPRAGVAQW